MNPTSQRSFASVGLIFGISILAQSAAFAWSSHAALCGEAKENCTVTFSNDGLQAGRILIPAGRIAGLGAVDKSERTCNMFGVCYRSLFQSENQEFTIAYLDDNNAKNTLIVSFVNAKAALKFSQEIQAFGQLAQAMKGSQPTEVLSPAEAAGDILTRTPPRLLNAIAFSEWQELSSEYRSGKTFRRFYTPNLIQEIQSGIYEYPSLLTSEGQSVQMAARIDCKRSLVTVSEQSVAGISRKPVTGWTKLVSISPGQMAFEIAQKVCLADKAKKPSKQ